MSGNSITELPNPIDRNAAANKNYVDNGGAIVKLPNGAFTDIEFDGFSLKNIPDPIECPHQYKTYYNRVGERKRTTR